MTKPKTTSKKTKTQSRVKVSKKQTSSLSWKKGRLLGAVVFILAFGGVGVRLLTSSSAATVSPIKVSTSDGCWLAGRVWSGTACETKCRSGAGSYISFKGQDGVGHGYCSAALAPWTSIGQTSCISSLHRKYVYDIGCARDTTQINGNSRDCQPDYPYYVANSGTDHCIVPATSTSSTSVSPHVNSNMDTVNNAYNTLWKPGLSQQIGWTGSVTGCNAGDMSAAARTDQINAVNFVRSLNGLSPVKGNVATLNAKAQQASLMMEANNSLSHAPPSTWTCYTSDGAYSAARSDLGLTSSMSPATSRVNTFMSDPGSGNEAVGHRRWILNPSATLFGFGSTAKGYAIQVIDTGTSNPANPDPTWTSWPSSGYFPTTIEPGGRWSASSGDGTASFASATVSVKHNGAAVAITQDAIHTGYGMPTIVWQMPTVVSPTTGGLVLPDPTGTYTVTVSNAKHANGTVIPAYTYNVTFFAPY